MIAVFGGPMSRRGDVIDSQWDSRIRRILETVPDANAKSKKRCSVRTNVVKKR